MESISYFVLALLLNSTFVLVCISASQKRVEQLFSRNETETEEGRVEEIELSSRTNSYIDVVENKACQPHFPSESVVDDEGEEILQFKYDIDTTIDENIKNSCEFTTELRHRKKAQEYADLYPILI